MDKRPCLRGGDRAFISGRRVAAITLVCYRLVLPWLTWQRCRAAA